MNQVIELLISSTGEVRVETKGFTGGSCRNASQYIEQALGQSAGVQLTGEYFAQQTQQQQSRQQTT